MLYGANVKLFLYSHLYCLSTMFLSNHIKHISYKSVKSYYTKHIAGGGTNFPSESIYIDRDSVGGAEGRNLGTAP